MHNVRDDYENGECPDCGLDIPVDAVVGSACENCEHVFAGNLCECGEELDKDCEGEPRCPICQGPCPCCDSGPGPV